MRNISNQRSWGRGTRRATSQQEVKKRRTVFLSSAGALLCGPKPQETQRRLSRGRGEQQLEVHGAGGWRALAGGAAGQGDSRDAVRAHARPVTQGDLPPSLITVF